MAGYNTIAGTKTFVMRQSNTSKKPSELDDDITVLDSDWLTSKFMVPMNELDVNFRFQAFKSSAHFKMQDTTLGGHRACNAPAQYTRYADIRANDFFYPWDPVTNSKGDKLIIGPNGKATYSIPNINFNTCTANTGMGRFYAESLDDGHQEVFLTFGIPKFNGLLDFFKSAISYEDSYIAKHGRVPTTFNKVNGTIAFLTAIAMPGTFIISLLLKKGFELVMGNTPYNYYYMEPNMHQYWSTVNTIANQIATAMGIMVPVSQPGAKQSSEARKLIQGKAMKFDQDIINGINNSFKDGTSIFGSTTNYIDVYELVCRYQNRVNTIMKANIESIMDSKGAFGTLKEYQQMVYKIIGEKRESLTNKLNQHTFTYDEDWKKIKEMGKAIEFNDVDDPKKLKGTNPDTLPDKDGETSWFRDALGRVVNYVSTKWLEGWKRREKVFDAAARLATSQAIFLVQPTGSTSESFSNSTGEIQTGGTLKSFGSAAHHANFNFSGGRLGIGFIDGLIDSAKQIAGSVIENVTFGAAGLIRGLMQGAYIDVPKIWEDSDCSFPTITYNIDLVAPYGNAYSRFQNIVVPLSMLLAGALPLRVGKASYQSPFLCSCYCQGVHHIRLGMITDLSITRGTGNLAQTIDRKTNAVSVSFTVTDFGHKLNAPINNSYFQGGWLPIIEEETPFSDYVDALTGRHISDKTWLWPQINNRFSNMLKTQAGYFSPTRVFGSIGEKVGRAPIISVLFSHPAMEIDTQIL